MSKRAVFHNDCKMVAFYYYGDTDNGATIRASKAELVNGTVPKEGDPMFCGSCGKAIGGAHDLSIGSLH